MRYIDKYRYHDTALAINRRFLKDCYANDIKNPLPSPADAKRSYDDFKKPAYRDGHDGWKSHLLNEQTIEGHARCCYCMRRLNPDKGLINYEHIIPRSLTFKDNGDDCQYYMNHAPALRDHVVIADVFCRDSFDSVNDIDQKELMPHTTALSNLLAACNGKHDSFQTTGCCCNGTRSDDKLLPLMLMANADTDTIYDANGLLSITSNDGTWDKTIQELNEMTLVEIRSVWYNLSKIAVDITTAETMPIAKRISWFKAAYNTENFESLPDNVKRYIGIPFATDDTYWKLLLAYDWFYLYPRYAQQRATA